MRESRSQTSHHQTSTTSYLRGLRHLWRYYRGWKWLIFIGLTISLVLSSYLVLIAKTTDVDTLISSMQEKTRIYDFQDLESGTLLAQKGTYVSLDQIAKPMQTSVIATEDKRFYDHNGFDTKGIGRALIRLLINRNTSGGGGSTITQQLAKNAFLSQDQTLQRKFKELFLALELEKTYQKDEILEMYLNNAYFGNGVWGVEDAALKYFGVKAIDLNWNQSLVLTGMLKGPSIYNPIDDYESALARRDLICDLLYQDEILTQAEQIAIKQSPIQLMDAYVQTQKGHEYPFYYDAVINEATQLTDIPEADLMAKGYKIYTYLNPAFQNALNQSYQDTAYLFNDDSQGDGPYVQSASAVVDPHTGGVMAVYGARGAYTYRGFNRAVDMYRAPGSAIKPLAVYLPALEAGYRIHTPVPDIVQEYGANHYRPENINKTTDPSGEVPLYLALAQSKNTSAVYLLDQLGIETAVKKLKQFGIEVPLEDRQLTLALGAFSTGVSPLQLASAYATFANQGIRQASNFIRRIEDASGQVVYDQGRPERHLIMTQQVAADMTSMMLDTYGGYGTGYGYGPDFGLLAGKTGSTEVSDGSDQTRDRWMVGYTPDFAIATWFGLDDVRSGNLDDMMPQGSGQVFKTQVNYLMAQSAQTPFVESLASQMTEDTNPAIQGGWAGPLKQKLEEWLDGLGQWLSQGLQAVQEFMDQAWRQVSEG